MLRGIAALSLFAALASPSVPPTPVAPGVPVVTVHAKDFAFVSPKSIAPGMTTFRFVNEGKELHQLQLIKLTRGKSLADFFAAIRARRPTPWAIDAGGPSAVLPGQTGEATVTLEPGSYIMVCWVPTPGEGVLHVFKGMMAELTVSPAGGVTQAGTASAPAPVPDLHLELADYSFRFSKPLTAGRHTIHVMNKGPQSHEVIFVKLAPGKSVQDFVRYLDAEKMRGPGPATPMPGLTAIAKGRTGIFTADITPGVYGLLCVLDDQKDHRAHVSHGMVQEITVK